MFASKPETEKAGSATLIDTDFEIAIAVEPAKVVAQGYIVVMVTDCGYFIYTHKVDAKPATVISVVEVCCGHICDHIAIVVYIQHFARCSSAGFVVGLCINGFEYAWL